MEAARALGMSYREAMRIIILPQAVVRMIPPLGNEFIALIKNSALVSLLTIADLMHEGQKIISVSYRSLGSVALTWNRHNGPGRLDHSGRKTEELIHKTDLACRAGLCHNAVTPADHTHHFEAFQGYRGRSHPLKATRWPDHTLGGTMVCLDDVVEILRGAMLDILRQQALLLQALDRLRGRSQFVSRN
jgi:hypothetical protein